jgi:hypothetical protein
MKIAFVGSRGFSDKELVKMKTIEYLSNHGLPINEFISGGAIGVDTWAQEIAQWLTVKCTIFKPNWDKHGKSAGFIRNKLIIDSADHVIAFWDGKSKGTKSSIDLAIAAGKPIDIYIRK